MMRNASVTCSVVGAAADVEEVGRFAAVILDDVHRAHRQAGPVDQTADVAGQADVTQARLRGPQLGGVFFRSVAQLLQVGMAEQGVVVEGDLGVDGHARRRLSMHHQRIDLGEAAILLQIHLRQGRA